MQTQGVKFAQNNFLSRWVNAVDMKTKHVDDENPYSLGMRNDQKKQNLIVCNFQPAMLF